MKVLFVTNMWPHERRPWYGTFVHSQAESLRALGVDLEVLPIRGFETRSAYVSAAVAVARTNLSGRYDLIHAHYGHSGVVGRFQFRAPLVVSYCGDDLLGTRTETGSLTPRSRVEAAIFSRLAWVSAATITKSAQMEARLPAALRARNHVIPSGVDLHRFKPVPRDEARRELGWDAGERLVLFAADPAIATKNFPLARAAVDHAAATIPNTRLHVVRDIAPDRMPLAMSAADALILTSRSEGSPNVVKEAMAAELPVVATSVGDVPERLTGVAGCHVCEPQAEALGDALVSALEGGRSPEARRAVEPISVESVAHRILSIYEDVLHRRNGAARSRDAC